MGIIAFLSMLIFCWVGETLMGLSLEIATTIQMTAYSVFSEDIESLKLTNIILLRAQRPLRLMVCTEGSMNMKFYSESMNKVVSLFLFLKTCME